MGALLEDFDPLLGWLWPLAYALLLVWCAVILLAPVVRCRDGRLRLLRDYGLALTITVVVAVLVGEMAGTGADTSTGPGVRTVAASSHRSKRARPSW